MGLSVYDGAMLVAATRDHPNKGRVVCLGMPTMRFSPKQLEHWCKRLGVTWAGTPSVPANERFTPDAFFKSLGYRECVALDVSAYEGATIIHNLNVRDLPAEHHGVASCVVDCGTLEHVFDLPAAFHVIGQLLEVGGLSVHVTPCNGYLDHGFYQICPTLLFDYYSANQFRIVSANILNRYPHVTCEPYVEDVYRRRGWRYGVERLSRSSSFFVAQKTAQSTSGEVPIQSYYREMHSGVHRQYDTGRGFSFSDDRARGLRGFTKKALGTIRRLVS